jgi:hypothetical protein
VGVKLILVIHQGQEEDVRAKQCPEKSSTLLTASAKYNAIWQRAGCLQGTLLKPNMTSPRHDNTWELEPGTHLKDDRTEYFRNNYFITVGYFPRDKATES